MSLLVVLAALTAAAAPPPTPLSPQAQAMVGRVRDAYAMVEADQAKLPPPKDDRERLERMYDLDQLGRNALEKLDLSLPQPQRDRATAAVWDEINAHDLADQQALKAMVARDGWITIPKYGQKASMAAFLVVQHAVDDPAFMRATLALLGPLAANGEVDGGDYALMYDRVALEFDHKPQRYGSQVVCVGGRWTPKDLEDAAGVDARRKAIGLKTTEAEYLTMFAQMHCN